jgi:hypothetical protein
MLHDLGRDLTPGGQSPLAVTAQEEHVGMERLSLVGLEPVDNQPLAFADPVLLAAD